MVYDFAFSDEKKFYYLKSGHKWTIILSHSNSF